MFYFNDCCSQAPVKTKINKKKQQPKQMNSPCVNITLTDDRKHSFKVIIISFGLKWKSVNESNKKT